MIINQINQFIKRHQLLPPGSKIILGLSGGPDSVFLLHLLALLHKEKLINLHVAHLDHQWRTDSHQDLLFCENIAKELGIPFTSSTITALTPTKWTGSQEEQGRIMRRQFLQKVCENEDANFIALAHHLQDQEETFFIRLIRGTSLAGLTAMKPKQGLYIRPLLETNKKDILTYLHDNKIAYLNDSSNESSQFLRNRIRHTVLPALQTCDDRFDNNFLITLNRLQDTESFLHQLVLKTFAEITDQSNGQTAIIITKFLAQHSVMRYRILIHWLTQEKVPFHPTQKFLDEIGRFLLHGQQPTHQLHEMWHVEKKKNKAVIKKYI
jgi:tRNA(Ile)-lysidine synthase